jgi:hypothetical protein
MLESAWYTTEPVQIMVHGWPPPRCITTISTRW